MNKSILLVSVAILTLLYLFYPSHKSIVFTETRTSQPEYYFLKLSEENQVEIIFTHSIHLSDVAELYSITPDLQWKVIQMSYEDLAIGMPGYAEKNQTLDYIDGKWVLKSYDTVLQEISLYNSSIHKKLEIRYDNEIYNLKTLLPTGASYLVEVKHVSSFELWRGEQLHGRE